MLDSIRRQLNESAEIKRVAARTLAEPISVAAEMILQSLKGGNKILLCGNGGSAADAQHIAAELVGRYTRERRGYAAIALTSNTSNLTAIGNDYGYDTVFERQIEALCRKGDVVLGISTSGNSTNILHAITKAKNIGARTIGLSGRDGGQLKQMVDLCLVAPHHEIARIQELHITIGHILCDLVEEAMSSS